MASTFSRTFILNFWFLPAFAVVFVVIVVFVVRLFVMSYWLPMHNKRPCSTIGAYLSVFKNFPWKLSNLMAVKTLKDVFENFFEHQRILLFWTVNQSQSGQDPHAFFCNYINLVSDFIFQLLIIWLQWHKIPISFSKFFGYFRIIGNFWTLSQYPIVFKRKTSSVSQVKFSEKI